MQPTLRPTRQDVTQLNDTRDNPIEWSHRQTDGILVPRRHGRCYGEMSLNRDVLVKYWNGEFESTSDMLK